MRLLFRRLQKLKILTRLAVLSTDSESIRPAAVLLCGGVRIALKAKINEAIASSDALTRKLDPVCFKYPSHRFGKNPITEMDASNQQS